MLFRVFKETRVRMSQMSECSLWCQSPSLIFKCARCWCDSLGRNWQQAALTKIYLEPRARIYSARVLIKSCEWFEGIFHICHSLWQYATNEFHIGKYVTGEFYIKKIKSAVCFWHLEVAHIWLDWQSANRRSGKDFSLSYAIPFWFRQCKRTKASIQEQNM